ncbi:MAG TPA: hypothetical protein VHP37_14550 [Burkholderiales bacterium]|nr:hypothetical protein [Burkholderiales bacterium]
MSLESELLEVISKYGLASASSKVAAAGGASLAPKLGGGSPVASYIREIITGDVAFDERVLQQVATVLTKGVGSR